MSGLPYLPGVTYLHVISPYSVRENVEQNKRDFERGYPLTLVQEILTVLSSPTETMVFATKQNKQRDFTVSYKYLQYLQSGHTQSQKNSYEHWTSFNSNLSLNISLTESSIVSYRKKKSLKNILVRAKIPSISQQSQNQRSG